MSYPVCTSTALLDDEKTLQESVCLKRAYVPDVIKSVSGWEMSKG